MAGEHSILACENRCSGCGVCSGICPKNAITLRCTEDGFYKPVCNDAECVSCGLCRKICYTEQQGKTYLFDGMTAKRLTAVCKDAQMLKSSASGGVASALSAWAMESGWHVVGTVYSADEATAVLICTADANDIKAMSGSKYIPCYTENGIKDSLRVSGKVLFIGTPCMVYSMRKLVETLGISERFYFVDFVCHGVPSLKVWQKNVESMGRKYHSEIVDVRFRSKHFGWHNRTVAYSFADGRRVYQKREKDDFMKLFDACFLSNESCFECSMNNRYSAADIRLGDYWGEKFQMNQEGVSRCAILTDRGQELWEKIADRLYWEVDNDIAYRCDNSYYLLARRNSALKRKVLSSLKDNDCRQIYRMYRRSLPLKRRIFDKTPKRIQNLYKAFRGENREW